MLSVVCSWVDLGVYFLIGVSERSTSNQVLCTVSPLCDLLLIRNCIVECCVFMGGSWGLFSERSTSKSGIVYCLSFV